MLAFFLSGVMIITDILLLGKERNVFRFPAKGRGKYHDTITVFEQEKQKQIRQMAYWEIVW